MLACACASGPPPLRWELAEGSRRSTAHRLSIELELVDVRTRVVRERGDGVDSTGIGAAESGATLRLEVVARATDERVSPHVIERTYDELGVRLVRRQSPTDRPTEVARDSAVVGQRVRFEPGVPSNLRTDLGGRWLLPEGDAREWAIAPAELAAAFWPGGFELRELVGEVWDTGDWPSVHIVPLPDLPPHAPFWLSRLEGEVTARRDGEGSIGFEFRVGGTGDSVEWLRTLLQHDGYVEVIGAAGNGVGWVLDGDGTATWDSTRGCFDALRLSGRVVVESDFEWSYLWDAPSVERFDGYRFERWAGTLELAVDVE